ncbi:Paraquat-inducible protein A [hydrothermal vent metagenome]|uniref:Paraquat-inducible protein A n=1 Tax=hydrothermal vent metagenome TaxID=652676 RepID=A0A1W1D040_9ZZZZ
MKLENEDALDSYIICHQCFTLHEEIAIADGSYATCSTCDGILYRYNTKLIEHGLALSITGLIFFILANSFALVEIEILGLNQFLSIPKMLLSLFDSGFYLVGFFCTFLVFIFPLMIFVINIFIFGLLKFKIGKDMSKELLVLLAHITPWSMMDIFLVSILVALVKLIGYAQIQMGVAFWALMLFVFIDLYLVKRIHIAELWMLRKRLILEDKKHDRGE